MNQNNQNNSSVSFYGLGIAPKILELLKRMKFVTPTPIQRKAIPIGIEGQDIVGVAQTGTGKTMAFGIPMVQRLAQGPGGGLVLVPTRELALQVDEALQKITRPFGMRTAVLIGGASMNNQVRMLHRHPRIIIATPGRFNDHLRQRTVRLNDIRILVLDEADRMLDMGFMPQIEAVLRNLPKERQTMLFSATIPEKVVGIAAKYMKLPVSVEIARSGTAAKNVTQELFIIQGEDKPKLLEKLLYQYRGTVLIFVRTKRGAARITRGIRTLGHNVAEIHSDRTLRQRRDALDGFKMGKYRILVATDIAARGIDVKEIELVINYDLPDDEENYVHRIGRTGRASHEGRAISFATPDQRGEVRDIEKVMQKALPIVKHPEINPASFYAPRKRSFGPRRSRFNKRRSRR
ncbi:MAG: DEAD/DEAH box helicase [Candidatus Margulisiibacteriota bacterium]|nr:DEAD/DEAH box helicase [Candidatus Margulisiibacteriota bacterium]